MRKETNEALNAIIKDLTDLPGGTAPEISLHAMSLVSVIQTAESDLRDCVNELCYQCGSYREAHNGVCNGCRWLTLKEGFRE